MLLELSLNLITAVIAGVISREQWNSSPESHKGHTRLHWKSTDPVSSLVLSNLCMWNNSCQSLLS